MADTLFNVTVSGNLAGQFVQSVFHIYGDVTPGYNIFQESINLATFLSDDWMQKFLACLPTDYIGTSLRVSGVSPTPGPTAILLPGAWLSPSTDGTRLGTISSAQVAPLITWIGTDNPSNTGRTYMPGVSEEDIDAMQLVPDLLTALNAFATVHSSDMTTGFGWTAHGVIYTRRQTTPVVVPASWDKIYDGQVSPLIGTQRRRLRPV